MYNEIKTVLLASLIAAMILPFSSMNVAEATTAESLESQIASIDKETVLMEVQQANEENIELELHRLISDKKILLHDLQKDLTKAQNENNDREARSLSSEISAAEQTILEKESEHLNSLIAIDDYEKKLVEKWNKKAGLVNLNFEQKQDTLRKTNTEFASAEQTIKTILESETISESQWMSFFDSLDVMLEDLGESKLDPQYKDELKDTILNDMYRQKQISQTSSYLESNFPEIHFLSASSSSCGTPRDYMPYHYQPTSDVRNGNGLNMTYAKMFDGSVHGKSLSGKCIIEVTHVYYDEDHPLIDAAYDLYRDLIYKRGTTDIETYFIVVDKNSGNVDRLSFQVINTKYSSTKSSSDNNSERFGAIYGGIGTWNNEKHLTKKLTSFTLQSQQHAKIYVNTWHHAYGEVDTNPSVSDTRTKTTTYTTGDRIKAENDFSSRNYTDEKLARTP